MDRPTNNIVPSRPTPNPRQHQHQESAADYMRAQIAQIYDEPEPAQGQPSQEPQQTGLPQAEPSAEQQQAQAAQKNPYAHTYRTDAQFDWNNYHSAWQKYYQEYYQRYYTNQLAIQAREQQEQEAPRQTIPEPESAAAEPNGVITGSNPEALQQSQKPADPRLAAARELQDKIRSKVGERAKKLSRSPHFKPIVTALAVGLVFLCLQFNQVIVAQVKYYISPGTLTNESSSIIIDPTATTAAVGQNPKIIIPKINVDVPVVYDEPSYKEEDVQKALQRGVVHYGTTAMPGQKGNNVILGHSSNDMFSGGGYKFAFIRIDALENGDVFILDYLGKRYVYKVYNKAIIDPSDFSLINIKPDKPVVTLITCTPPGTTLKRLVVQGEQISPSPDSSQTAATQPQSTTTPIPSGNAPSLLERLGNLF